jgi:hypothetical protein
MMGLNAKTEAQVTSQKNTITPRLLFVRDDSDRRIRLFDLIRSSASDKGNTIIYVNDKQRRNYLAEFLLDHSLGEFSERILLTTTQDMGSITGMDNKHEDLSLWQKFLDDVTSVLNYEAPPDLESYKRLITWGMDFTNKDVIYTSFIDLSSPDLCVDLLNLLTDSRTLETLRMIPRSHVPAWLEDMVRTYVSHMSPQPTFLLGHVMGSSKQTLPTSGSREFRGNFNARGTAGVSPGGVSGASRPARPASGSREFRSTFNTQVAAGVSPEEISIPSAGVSPEKISMPSEVRREHVGMRDGDWYCCDCEGYVWKSKTVCDSFKCHRRRQEQGTSASEMVNSPSRPKEREISVPCSPVVTKHAELRTVSFAVDDEEDSRCSTDISPVSYSHSGEQSELKRARGVRDPAYQREILDNRKIVWHADKGIWVYLDAPGGSDTIVEATTEV